MAAFAVLVHVDSLTAAGREQQCDAKQEEECLQNGFHTANNGWSQKKSIF